MNIKEFFKGYRKPILKGIICYTFATGWLYVLKHNMRFEILRDKSIPLLALGVLAVDVAFTYMFFPQN